MKIAVEADDPLTQIGIVTVLASSGNCAVLGSDERAQAQVLVLATDRLTASTRAHMRRNAQTLGTPVVLIVTDLDEQDLLNAVECKVVSVIPRTAFTAAHLTQAVRVATSGGAAFPARLTGLMIRNLEEILRESTERQAGSIGLDQREIAVLRLIADGHELSAIAKELRYSVRTIRNVISGVLGRLNLRNRSQAVAYAARAGVI
ncbi:response regulator transcription factor [Lentzea sp. NPDC051213]|uniref:response regulator transcription factor n=1 Tax=Lentzea sp. NPDC051213 TaxID=3364126 RepID=UPI00379CB02A